jgi:hypothetical protein
VSVTQSLSVHCHAAHSLDQGASGLSKPASSLRPSGPCQVARWMRWSVKTTRPVPKKGFLLLGSEVLAFQPAQKPVRSDVARHAASVMRKVLRFLAKRCNAHTNHPSCPVQRRASLPTGRAGMGMPQSDSAQSPTAIGANRFDSRNTNSLLQGLLEFAQTYGWPGGQTRALRMIAAVSRSRNDDATVGNDTVWAAFRPGHAGGTWRQDERDRPLSPFVPGAAHECKNRVCCHQTSRHGRLGLQGAGGGAWERRSLSVLS